ncbi:MAG: exopolysaccharide biosynthesis polyprenyl glycosylphosphotransferase [Clostridiales bacterium]|nr:exopolysaccharide biosynthesis polyprenyl glycosylphosphotransferase [Clostridiales bacterium]HBM81704.1 sugar transferase [Clostridiaceae bacterium]
MQFEVMRVKIIERLESRKLDLSIKRLFDFFASLILFIILLPVMIVISILIKAESEGPVIFRQKRIGYMGRPFTIFKFRTMVNNAENLFRLNVDKENLGSLVFQDKDDPRITKIGGFLRRTSLDELPQLVNVLIGNMTLVGPRPEIPAVADLYNDKQKLRLYIKPGVTGLAQVSGRGEIELDKTIEFDLEYIMNFSIWLDVEILFRTIRTVFKKEGAY